MTPTEEAAAIIHHLTIRKRINPLEFFEPLKYQKLFAENKAKIKGIFGGNRSGKSEEGAAYVIQKCLAKPRQRWWAVAETDEVSIQVQQRKIYELLPKNEMRYCHYDEVNGFRNGKVIFKNGSSIKFKTYKQGREAFASDDLDGIWNDEEPPAEIHKEQKMRLIDRDGEMIFTMTSLKGITELMQELFEDHDVIESQYAPLIDEEIPRIVEKNGVPFFMLWTTENRYINQERLAADLKVMTKQEIKSRIYGIPMNLSGRIYPNFSRHVHVVPVSFIPKTKVCIWHILDPHDHKPWAMQWWVVDRAGRAYCVREYPWRKNFNEIEFDDKTYADYARVIEQTELGLIQEYGRSVSVRIIDPNSGNATERKAERENGGTSKTTPKQELKRLGFKFIDGIDALEAGHLAVKKALHYEKRDEEWVVKPLDYYSEECENSIRHMSRYARKDGHTPSGDVRDQPGLLEKHKDFPDCHRYFRMAGPRYMERISPHRQEETERMY